MAPNKRLHSSALGTAQPPSRPLCIIQPERGSGAKAGCGEGRASNYDLCRFGECARRLIVWAGVGYNYAHLHHFPPPPFPLATLVTLSPKYVCYYVKPAENSGNPTRMSDKVITGCSFPPEFLGVSPRPHTQQHWKRTEQDQQDR